MRCETSFFSLTLYTKYLRRYWPMWGVWLLGWLLVMPVQLWNELVRRTAQLAGAAGDPERAAQLTQAMRAAVEELSEWWRPNGVCIAAAAILTALAVYFYLFKGTSANFIYALPLRREGVFLTSWAAGCTIILGPLAVTAAVTFLVECVFGVADPSVFIWLGYSVLLTVFWLSFATLCCVITGNSFAAVAFYGIFNGVAAAMMWLIQLVLDGFLYGFSRFSDETWEMVAWLTPVYRIIAHGVYLDDGGVSDVDMLCRYAAIGLLMLAAAGYLHHIRKAERAGDIIAFKYLRIIFKVCVTVCGGLAFGMLFAALLFGSASIGAGLELGIGCCLAAALSWFIAEMFVRKSLKVFKAGWKGALISAACFALAICAVDMDWVGFTTRVPQAGQVRWAEAAYSGWDLDPAVGGLWYEGADVERLTDLHSYLTQHRDDLTGERYYRVEITYQLGFTRQSRVYGFSASSGSEAERLFRAAVGAGRVEFDVGRSAPAWGSASGVVDNNEEWYAELASRDLEVLWGAIRSDVEAGRYRALPQRPRSYVDLALEWPYGSGARAYEHFYVREGCTDTLRAIEELGLRQREAGNSGGNEVPVDAKTAG